MFAAKNRKQTETDLTRMLAILGDAIAHYRDGSPVRAQGAENWMREDDWHSTLSFNNVCAALRMDPDSTRIRVLGDGTELELSAA